MRRIFKNKKFRTKLFIIFSVIIILFTLGASGIWYRKSKIMIMEQIYINTRNQLNERMGIFNMLIKNIDYISLTLSRENENVRSAIHNTWEDPYLRMLANRNMENYLDSLYSGEPYISTLIVEGNSGTRFLRGMSKDREYINNIKDEWGLDKDIYKTAIVPYTNNEGEIKEVLIIRNILYKDNVIGHTVVGIDYGKIKNIFDNIFTTDSICILYNERNERIYDNGVIASEEKFKELISIDIGEEQYKSLSIEGKEHLFINIQNENFNLQVIGVVPIYNTLMEISETLNGTLILILLGLAVVLIIAEVITKNISSDIEILKNGMEKFSKGDLETTIKVDGTDEFSYLAQYFNEMTFKINSLLDDVKNKEKEKASLEIEALQGQINQHFLFNTLNTIKNLCYIQRATNIEKLVNAFMELLRFSMHTEEEMVLLKEEAKYINYYLEIYKYKNLEDIQMYIKIDEEIEDALVPKFILQPIVENSIIHGFDSIEEGKRGIIIIKGSLDEEVITLTVMDNGKGFPCEEIKSKFNGIGIKNIDKRIKINFGNEYGISINSVPDISTTVEIKFPYRRGGTNV